MTYEISYSNGQTETADTLREAYEALIARYPEMTAIHEIGQLDWSESDKRIEQERDGYRILVWKSEEESANDDGRHAVASVRCQVECAEMLESDDEQA